MIKKGIPSLLIFLGIALLAVFGFYTFINKQSLQPSTPASITGIRPTVIAPAKDLFDEVKMVVFVHGSMTLLVRKLNLETITSIAHDQTEGTLYQMATDRMRHNPFFMRDQAMQDLGLRPIDKTCFEPGKAATALANIFDRIELWTTGKPDHTLYYTFGWEALVSEKIRMKSSRRFYQELFDEINRLTKQGYKKIVLQIIGYSHGGAVALALADVHATKPASEQISVDELILLGTPLHSKMYTAICSPLFKKIYNIYSLKDLAQRLDLTAPGFLSQHIFVAPEGKQLPDKLTQIQLSVTRNRTTKYHYDSTTDPHYNFDLHSVVTGSSNLFRRVSPTHGELWFFEWAAYGYRNSFSLRPLPIVALVPIMLDAIKKSTDLNQKHFIVDLRPDQELFLIKTPQGHTVAPLLTHSQFTDLKIMAYAYDVTQHPRFEYDEQAHMAIIWAEQERKLLKINASAPKQNQQNQ
jgi:hypothetical protein